MIQEKLSIRPYARLLAMLGDQLIKNEQIALVEIIKNSYDADADWVNVRFENFNEDMSANEESSIVVEDNGCGMTPDDIRNAWMNPATPQKYNKKQAGKINTPKNERVIQGEKGIGRFAVLKLGKKVTVSTKTSSSEFESVLEYDFTRFDDDFTLEGKEEREIFLDEIKIDYSEVTAPNSIKEHQGTIIKIQKLKNMDIWNADVIRRLCKDISNLTDPVSKMVGRKPADNFKVSVIFNGELQPVEDDSIEDLRGLMENKSVLRISGNFDSNENLYIFTQSEDESDEVKISVNSPKIKGLWIWRKRFGREDGADKDPKNYQCGDFKFHFNIFDFSRGIPGKYELTQQQKNILKGHRIYLYRDDVRVYPYGDPDDDWLGIDVTRGTGRAGDSFSNDQIIGWIDISQKDNPDLRDKTNREGLIEKGDATRDLIFLVQAFLSYIKQHSYAQYEQRKRDKNVAEMVRGKAVTNHLADLKSNLVKKGYKPEARQAAKIEKEYKKELDHLVYRAEVTEDLAGVGLSVEMTSHDIMLMMDRAQETAKKIAKLARNCGDDEIQEQATILVGILTQISDGMQDVQSLFKSAKRRRKSIRIESILDKIYDLYKSLLEKRGIHYEKEVLPGSPLVADTNDGVVMQVLINLFDNSAYWLNTVNREQKEIKVIVNGEKGELIFSDNGPGIDKEDLPYIFEPFYSGKGQEGRGLGLYIAKQLLERHDYSISVVEREKDKVLTGANFSVNFFREEN